MNDKANHSTEVASKSQEKQPTANEVKQWMNAQAEPQQPAGKKCTMELNAFHASTSQTSGGYGKRVEDLVKGLMNKTLL